MSTELQVVDSTIDAEVLADLTIRRPPDEVLEEARKAAVCLKDVLDKKDKKVMMGEEQYLEFEDWQTVGKFYGVTCAEEGDPTYVEIGAVTGFKANSVALHNGKTISRATAFCMTDEEKWGERNKYAWAYCLKSGGTSVEDPGPTEIIWMPNPNKPGRSMPKKERILVGVESVPLYQLASMAQTRANSKVLRNVLSWVVVLAGYKPTPSEEMPNCVIVPQQTAQGDLERDAAAPRGGKSSSEPGLANEPVKSSDTPAPSHAAADAAILEQEVEAEYRQRFSTVTEGKEANPIYKEVREDARLSPEAKDRLYSPYAGALKTKKVKA